MKWEKEQEEVEKMVNMNVWGMKKLGPWTSNQVELQAFLNENSTYVCVSLFRYLIKQCLFKSK